MGICIDARMINHSGIGTYIRTLLTPVKNLECFSVILPEGFDEEGCKDLNPIFSKAPIYSFYEQLDILRKVVNVKHSLLHIPHYNIPILYKGRMLVTVHDLIHFKFPQLLPNKAALIYSGFMFRHICNKVEKIIAVSQNTKRDLMEMLDIPECKIQVIYNGLTKRRYDEADSDSMAGTLKKFGIFKMYLLYVGNVRSHKNIERLFQAFKIIKDKNYDIQLVITGAVKESYNSQTPEDVIFTGYVNNEDLNCLYCGAEIFVFPSLYEGFGYPPLEAMQHDVPVVCSNSSSLPEVVGDAALMFDPYDIEDMANKIINVMTDNTLKDSLKIKGREQIKKFDIVEFEKQMTSLYRSML